MEEDICKKCGKRREIPEIVHSQQLLGIRRGVKMISSHINNRYQVINKYEYEGKIYVGESALLRADLAFLYVDNHDFTWLRLEHAEGSD